MPPALPLLLFAAAVLAAMRLRDRSRPLVERIDARLPQTQCRQCGYDGCRPYAEAIATGATIDRCPPGGEALVRRLARLTGRPVLPLDRTRGVPKAPQVALIDETSCIGCTLCIQACPVDAIVGAPKLMHTVIAEHCTGCELCLPPCPVDCIALAPRPLRLPDLVPGATAAFSRGSRQRYRQRLGRRERDRAEHAARLAAKAAACAAADDSAAARKREIVAAAVQRAREKLATSR